MSGPSKSSDIIYDLCEDSDSNGNEPLISWDKNDLFQLYLAIKYKGSKGIKAIKESYLPHKTEAEINAAIMYYREIVIKGQDSSCKMKRRVRPKPLIPLARWAKLLTDTLSFKELQTETASALRLIADFEPMPCPKLTEQIAFPKIYHSLADAMEGKAPEQDRLIEDILSSCVLDSALVSKSFIKLSQLRNIVNNVNISEKELTGFPRPTTDSELSVIRELSGQINYNPLHITEDSLRPPPVTPPPKE